MTTRAEIEKNNADFVDAFDRGDSTAINASYAEDCSVLVPNHATVHGRQEVSALFQGMFDEIGGKTSLQIVELEDAGDWAYQWLAYTLEAEEVYDSGRVVEILKRQSDGSWKIHLSIFNSERE